MPLSPSLEPCPTKRTGLAPFTLINFSTIKEIEKFVQKYNQGGLVQHYNDQKSAQNFVQKFNEGGLVQNFQGGGFSNITNTETTTDPSNPFSFGVNYVSPEEAKEKLAARGMPSMELMDGTVVPNFGKMGVDSFNQGIEMVREGMANNPEKLKELDNFLDTNPYAQPDELQRLINSVVPGSQAHFMDELGASISASAKMNGGGLVQAFQGGGQVRRLQMGRSAAKNRANITPRKTATVITPSEKKKVTVAYQEEKQSMENNSNAEKSSQEIPQFDVTLGRSSKKISLLGISV